MTQNIYDNGTFFGEYCKLGQFIARSSRCGGMAGATIAASRTARTRGIGSRLRFWVVLPMGARTPGASRVLGIDVSENMLKRARELTSDGGITYEKADLERVTLPSTCFDLAYSSLALHYLENLPRVFAEVHDALVPGGSVHFLERASDLHLGTP